MGAPGRGGGARVPQGLRAARHRRRQRIRRGGGSRGAGHRRRVDRAHRHVHARRPGRQGAGLRRGHRRRRLPPRRLPARRGRGHARADRHPGAQGRPRRPRHRARGRRHRRSRDRGRGSGSGEPPVRRVHAGERRQARERPAGGGALHLHAARPAARLRRPHRHGGVLPRAVLALADARVVLPRRRPPPHRQPRGSGAAEGAHGGARDGDRRPHRRALPRREQPDLGDGRRQRGHRRRSQRQRARHARQPLVPGAGGGVRRRGLPPRPRALPGRQAVHQRLQHGAAHQARRLPRADLRARRPRRADRRGGPPGARRLRPAGLVAARLDPRGRAHRPAPAAGDHRARRERVEPERGRRRERRAAGSVHAGLRGRCAGGSRGRLLLPRPLPDDPPAGGIHRLGHLLGSEQRAQLAAHVADRASVGAAAAVRRRPAGGSRLLGHRGSEAAPGASRGPLGAAHRGRG